ncbi:MAG: hypothetical protein DRP85_08225 [Candidatus Makaraimicrobium thalassicum]|nr:MAG: hypothetical protein DRP85_08225 [Candidatus Omnitrophota bacterium]
MDERRKHERFNLVMDALCPKDEAHKRVRVRNFSREGLGIISEGPIPEGVDVELELMIPGESTPVIAAGRIAWIMNEKADGEKQYKMGVKLRDSEHGGIFSCIYKRWMRMKSQKEDG